MDLVAGAAVGTVFGMLYEMVKIAIGKSVKFKHHLRSLKLTLDSLEPVIIQQIGLQNIALGLPNDEVTGLETQMQKGLELVQELMNAPVKWNYFVKPSYANRLVEVDESLKKLLKKVELQQARDVKETLYLARSIKRDTDTTTRHLPPPPPLSPPPTPPPLPPPPQVVYVERNIRKTVPRQVVSERSVPQRERNGMVKVMAEGAAAVGDIFDVVMEVRKKTMMAKSLIGDLKSTTSWISKSSKRRRA